MPVLDPVVDLDLGAVAVVVDLHLLAVVADLGTLAVVLLEKKINHSLQHMINSCYDPQEITGKHCGKGIKCMSQHFLLFSKSFPPYQRHDIFHRLSNI